jgi:hypothetical protein
MSLLYSIIESPAHPDMSSLYRKLGIDEIKLNSQRKAINQLKRRPPDWVVAEFFYGFGNNYAGVNVSNLDVFLHSLRKYAPQARVIVLASPRDYPHIDKLTGLFDVHSVLRMPVSPQELQQALEAPVQAG